MSRRPMAEVEQLLLQPTRDHAAAGNIRQVATRTRDVIDAVAQVALFNERTLRQGLNAEDLGLQLEFGLPEELVALAQVVGTELNRGEYLALLGANITEAEHIRSFSSEGLVSLIGESATGRLLRLVAA